MRGKVSTRLLSALLTAAMLFSLLPPAARAVERTETAGSISAALRIDYDQSIDELQERGVRVEVRQNGAPLGSVELAKPGEYTLSGHQAVVSAKNADGGDLGGGLWPGCLELAVRGLPLGTYTLRFTGRGFVPYEQTVELRDYAQHIILGTGDATFTLGDVDGNGRIDEADRDALAKALGSEATADIERYDLNGDEAIDIVDLAVINRQISAEGGAEILNTALLALAVDQTETLAELAEQNTQVLDGSLESLFVDNEQSVRFAAEGGGDLVIPIVLREATEPIGEIQIISPAGVGGILTGEVLVEAEDGETFRTPFDLTPPENTFAISTLPGSNVITINLGRRVAVKKVTITVTKTESGSYAEVESIQFLRDIVPENPAAPHSVVKNLTAVPGSESVELSWNLLPNVSGYKILYWPVEAPTDVKELHVDVARADVTGLENGDLYAFTVTPTDGEWEGKPCEPVTAMPETAKAPDRVDMVSVSAQDAALSVSWKESKGASYYEVFYQRKDADEWTQAGGQLTQTRTVIEGLENGVTYCIYVVAGNALGKAPRSAIAEGTPKAVVYERPEGIPVKGILDSAKIASVRLADPNNYDRNAYTADSPFDIRNVIDDNYRTHWTARNWSSNEHIVVTFTEPVNLRGALWVPRMDGTYANNLRGYSARVWYEGDDLNGAGTQLIPAPSSGISDAVGSEHNWPNVSNYNSVLTDQFAIMPLGSLEKVAKISIAAEQKDYLIVSCAELLFLEYDPDHDLEGDIARLFTDDLHTQLAGTVTVEQISALRERLKGEERSYCLYPAVLEDELALAEELLTSGRSSGVLLDGIQSRSGSADSQYGQGGSVLQPLGAAAGAKQVITIYAEGIRDGSNVSVCATQYNAEVSAWQKTVGALSNGRNVLTIPKVGSRADNVSGGSLYLTYAGEGAENIKIHVRRAVAIPTLEIADWYSLDETARRERIGSYVDALEAYTQTAKIAAPESDWRNVTELSTPVVLLSLPALAVQNQLKGTREMNIEVLYQSIEAWEDIMHICKYTQGIDNTLSYGDMQTRQNVRCMTMFAGAFMYAAGSHIGIGYGSSGGMVAGKPISTLADGAQANQLFGWGIAHEIGHNMDKLGKAEITNNIYSLMVQTYDGNQNLLPSRLEKSNKYAAIFNKVAQGYPGASGDVFVQLGMYWQLHLAYDDGAAPMDFYNRFFKAWKAGTYFDGASSYDDKVALTASAVAGKDLTEFFTRWGMQLSSGAKAALQGYGAESRAIWYLNDQSRRDRLNGVQPVSGTLSAAAEKQGDKEVLLTFDGLTGSVQGYEIRRDGKAIAFVPGGQTSYTDTIGSANHRVYQYEVVAYDTLGNVVDSANAGEIRIAYDLTVDPSSYESTWEEDGTVTVQFKKETTVSGLKLVYPPESGAFTVQVVRDGEDSQPVTACMGDFSQPSQSADDPSSFVAYFNNPEAGGTDSSIWAYSAKTITISGIPEGTDLADLQWIHYAGDDVAFLEGATVGRLAADYNTGSGTIPQGALVVAGTYRSDPVYCTMQIRGRNLDGTGERAINGDLYVFASIPTYGDGKLSDISDGIFLFVVNEEAESIIQDEEAGDAAKVSNALPSQICVELYRTDDPYHADSKRLTAQTLWINSPGGVGEELPSVVLQSE